MVVNVPAIIFGAVGAAITTLICQWWQNTIDLISYNTDQFLKIKSIFIGLRGKKYKY